MPARTSSIPPNEALLELSKAVKTCSLYRYLADAALRREINDGMNVVEQCNSSNDFVFFSRRGEMSKSCAEDHELGLHLLQNCMVFVNTLMLQHVLARSHWAERLTVRNRQALTPLFPGAREPLRPLGTRHAHPQSHPRRHAPR